MPLSDFLALKHPMLVHIPIAAALLVPIPLLAAQRSGRGIKPWWIACRYLTWMGVLGALPALLSGLLWAKLLGLIPGGSLLAPSAGEDQVLPFLMRRHQMLALLAFLFGLVTLWSLYRKRQEHQGIGFLPLAMGCLWALSTALAGQYGGKMTHPLTPIASTSHDAPAADPEADAPLRALDYASLEPALGPVFSKAHGNRWVRVWVTASGIDAYKAGRPLSPGSYAVMNSFENANGRASNDAGPLYALEILASGEPSLTLYWPRVPQEKRNEVGGLERVYWRGAEAGLQSCMSCHAGGASELVKRSALIERKALPLGQIAPPQSLP
jgi:hypothetical protein